MNETTHIRLGLLENWRQFSLLVVVNAFVGSMVGLERSVLPLLAEHEFGIASRSAILAFIVTFGASKALANLFAGRLGDRYGRKHVLVAGWLFALPVPLIVIAAPSWQWIVYGNLLLGVSQGLTWSTTVIMKIDLVGPAKRGLAMGLNEAAGYIAVAAAAALAGYVASVYGLRPYPFYLGVVFAVTGLLLSLFSVRETRGHVHLESAAHAPVEAPTFGQVFRTTSWTDRTLFSISQAGMVNNLNDGMAWGLFPLVFHEAGLSLGQVGLLAGLYPAVWGFGQLVTGALSDRIGRKRPIVSGMLLQAIGIFLMTLRPSLSLLASAMVLLGLGTALVYPTFLAAIGDVTHPAWRGTTIGVYRLWRDGGYVVGALLAGITADLVGTTAAILVVGLLTAASGLLSALLMRETLHLDRA